MTGTFSIFVTTSAYLLYYFITQDAHWRHRILGYSPGALQWKHYILYFQRGMGTFLLGVVPAVATAVCCPELFGHMGLHPVVMAKYPVWFAAGLALMYVLSLAGARSPDTQARYPEAQIAEWTPKLFAQNAGSWVLYLAGYEFLFRGVLLFGCYQAFGWWPAVAINISLYSFAHLWKGWRETLGSAVFGALASWATLHTGTVWLPFLAHCVTSIHAEYRCIRLRSDMKFVP